MSVLSTWGKLAEIIVKWYVLILVWYAILWVLWVLSGSNPYNMIINMTAALSGVLAIIVLIDVLRRKIRTSG